jgi:hypothetical protein
MSWSYLAQDYLTEHYQETFDDQMHQNAAFQKLKIFYGI